MTIRVEAVGNRLNLTLDDRPTRNALSAAAISELRAALAGANADPAVRVVVIGHSGDVFSSGIDLREASGVAAADQPIAAFPALLSQLRDARVPIIAAVAGKARGAGAGLAAACDVLVASPAADFAFTEVRLGLVPASVAGPLLTRVGPASARELLLTGAVVDAVRAERIGLANSVVDDLGAEVQRYVDLLAAGGPSAMATTKALLGRDRSATEDPVAMARLSARHFAGPEGQEGIAARREGRAPQWPVQPGSQT